jgi:hypothetical protein
MSDYRVVQDAVTEYVRDYVAALRRRGESYERIGERLGCSHVWIMHLSQPEKYGKRRVGADIEHKLAELLHGGSVDALRRAALSLSEGGTVTNEHEGSSLELGPRAGDAPGDSSAPRRRRRKTT